MAKCLLIRYAEVKEQSFQHKWPHVHSVQVCARLIKDLSALSRPTPPAQNNNNRIHVVLCFQQIKEWIPASSDYIYHCSNLMIANMQRAYDCELGTNNDNNTV